MSVSSESLKEREFLNDSIDETLGHNDLINPVRSSSSM